MAAVDVAWEHYPATTHAGFSPAEPAEDAGGYLVPVAAAGTTLYSLAVAEYENAGPSATTEPGNAEYACTAHFKPSISSGGMALDYTYPIPVHLYEATQDCTNVVDSTLPNDYTIPVPIARYADAGGGLSSAGMNSGGENVTQQPFPLYEIPVPITAYADAGGDSSVTAGNELVATYYSAIPDVPTYDFFGQSDVSVAPPSNTSTCSSSSSRDEDDDVRGDHPPVAYYSSIGLSTPEDPSEGHRTAAPEACEYATFGQQNPPQVLLGHYMPVQDGTRSPFLHLPNHKDASTSSGV